MKRLLLILTGLVALALPASASAESVGLSLSPAGEFPTRTWVVTLPPDVDPADVAVSENGVPVIPRLRPIANDRLPLSLVLVLDSSQTMRGEPMEAALDAAATLIAEKPAKAEVAAFGYSKDPYTIRTWTTDPNAFTAPFAKVETSFGTAVWDSVLLGSQLVQDRKGAAKAMVLLTDGKKDISSETTADAAITRAKQSGVRVFVVSLGSDGKEQANLERLVDATGGELITVTTLAQLDDVYREVGETLARQYVLSYASQIRGAGTDVQVVLTAGDLSAEQSYTVPSNFAPSDGGGDELDLLPWLLIALAVGLMVALGSYLVLRPVKVRPAHRLRGYGVGALPQLESLSAVNPEPPARRGARPGGGQVWRRFVADVDRGQVGTSALVIVLGTLAAGVLLSAVVVALTGRIETVLVCLPLPALVAWVTVTRKASAWYAHFDATLADSLMVLASSLRAGHSLLQGLAHVAEEADDRTAAEWNEVVKQTRLGMSIEDALDEMVVRVGNNDLQWIALVARVQRQVGGNMAEMFDIVAETVRQRHRLRAQVQTLTVQGRMTRWILTLAPLALAALFWLVSPNYLAALTDNSTGMAMIGIAVVLSVVGSVWLKQIVEIEV
jgi:tight adherence protein B